MVRDPRPDDDDHQKMDYLPELMMELRISFSFLLLVVFSFELSLEKKGRVMKGEMWSQSVRSCCCCKQESHIRRRRGAAERTCGFMGRKGGVAASKLYRNVMLQCIPQELSAFKCGKSTPSHEPIHHRPRITSVDG